MSVRFYPDYAKCDSHGEVPLRVSVYVCGRRLVTSLPFKVMPDKWDATAQKVRKGVYNFRRLSWSVINAELARVTQHFNLLETMCLDDRRVPTLAEMRELLKNTVGGKRRMSATATGASKRAECTPGAAPRSRSRQASSEFWARYEEFVRERSRMNSWSVATISKFKALRGHLEGWRRLGRVSFDMFDEAGLMEFVEFLRVRRGHKNSTIGKQLGYLKWFLRWATLKGYTKNTAYQVFAPKLRQSPHLVVYLDADELRRVMEYRVPPSGTVVELHDAGGRGYSKRVEAAEGLELSRDIFGLCCYTSLRFSDAINLKWSDVSGESITVTMVKTGGTVTIELNRRAREILDKYRCADVPGGYVMPRITIQKMNDRLKDLCELCGINQLVTRTYFMGARRVDETHPKYELVGSHTGRRTFICNALSMGIPAEIVMKWTGHSDYKSMKPYVDICNSAKAREMLKFDAL